MILGFMILGFMILGFMILGFMILLGDKEEGIWSPLKECGVTINEIVV